MRQSDPPHVPHLRRRRASAEVTRETLVADGELGLLALGGARAGDLLGDGRRRRPGVGPARRARRLPRRWRAPPALCRSDAGSRSPGLPAAHGPAHGATPTGCPPSAITSSMRPGSHPRRRDGRDAHATSTAVLGRPRRGEAGLTGRLPVVRQRRYAVVTPTVRSSARRMVSGPCCPVPLAGLLLTAEEPDGSSDRRSVRKAPAASATGARPPAGGRRSSFELVDPIASSLLPSRPGSKPVRLHCPPVAASCEGPGRESLATSGPQPASLIRRSARARKARPRWLKACFSVGDISANVRPSPLSGTNTGS